MSNKKVSNEAKSKPVILDFYEFNDEHKIYLIGAKVYEPVQLKCKNCSKVIKASIFTTSN
jgi:hypothetical protein